MEVIGNKVRVVAVIAFFMVFVISTSSAQMENRFSIGPRIGANFANVDPDATSSVTRFVAGITTTYSINEQSGVTVDLLYAGEGYDAGSTEYRFDYFKIPILYNVFLGKLGQPFRPKIYAGIAPGFLLLGEQNQSAFSSNLNAAVVDVVGGLGFNYRLANRVWLNADLRSFVGISDLTKSETKISNRTIQFSLGVAYGI